MWNGLKLHLARVRPLLSSIKWFSQQNLECRKCFLKTEFTYSVPFNVYKFEFNMNSGDHKRFQILFIRQFSIPNCPGHPRVFGFMSSCGHGSEALLRCVTLRPKEFLSPYVKRHPPDSWVPSLHVLSEVHECDTVPYKTNQFFVSSARDNTSNV